MQATQWRGHPSVPGIASGWFETTLGGVAALHHTGARHHFSVAWISPRQQVGVFLVHSMRQGGPFQSLRTNVIREFVRRYLPADTDLVAPRASHGVAGVYRPLLLSTTTVERLGYLFLDTRVQIEPDGRLTLHAPGELGTVRAEPIGEGVFEVHDGPQAGLRIEFVAGSSPQRMVIGGTLLDPVMMERLSWWQRGQVHAIALGGAALVLTLSGMFHGVRALFRRNQRLDGVTLLVMTVAAGFILALITFVLVVLTNPEAGAAAHMRAGLHGVLAWLTVSFAGCVALPMVTAITWSRSDRNRKASVLLALAAVTAAVLLWRYRLVGFQL
jgi:uncharacterized membrane-anchored protein